MGMYSFSMCVAVLLSVITVFMFSERVACAEERGRFYALCVGLKYPGTRNSLRFTTDDVRKVTEAFRVSSGYDADQCRVEILVDDDPKRGKPTLRDIRRILADLANDADENDRLVFYFSGHGILDKSGRSILVCGDGSDLNEEDSHLPLAEVKDVLARSRARDKLTIIDACHSGGKSADDGGLTPDSIAAAMSGGVGVKGAGDPVAWLVSCGQNEKSWEDEDAGHGLFTRYFLEAVGESAEFVDSDYDGKLSVREIHDYISKSIGAYILRKNRSRDAKWRGVRQTPLLGFGDVRDPDLRALRRLNLFYYEYGSSPSDTPTSQPSLGTAAIMPMGAGDSAEALFNQGLSLYEGTGGSPRYEEALKLFRQAAEQDYAAAQNQLGYCYSQGQGVAHNYSEAMKWHRKAAEQGNADAQYRLGLLYQMVVQDNQEAEHWYRKAAEQGHMTAQKNMGTLYYYGYYDGKGVTKDIQEATKWFRKAAEQGSEEAKRLLGNF